MKKKLILIFGLNILLLNAFAQSQKGEAYINKYKDIAINEMIRSGVPAAITLAQGILESSYGESNLCIQSNNHFGIKCKTEWTGEKVYHDDDAKHECFRSYPDATASYKDHSDFLKTRPWYASLFQLQPTDFEGWAYGLKKAGYATEKDYPQKLLKVINDYNLNQYTLLALNGNIKTEPAKEDFTALKKTAAPKQQQITGFANTITPTPMADEKEEVEVYTKKTTEQTSKSSYYAHYPEGVFTINHVKVIYAKAGTSLLSVANQYSSSLGRLLEFNEISENKILANDNLLFIEKKLKKGAKDFHIVEKNETLYDICQEEGVRMDCVLLYNGIKKDSKPVNGEKIYLRSNAPVSPKTEIALHLGDNNASTN